MVVKKQYLYKKLYISSSNLFNSLPSLQTTSLNKHLSELMENLSAKVFRTYNASKTLQDQLVELTDGKSSSLPLDLHTWLHLCNVLSLAADDNITSKILSYNRANRAVAILCNHQVCTRPSYLTLCFLPYIIILFLTLSFCCILYSLLNPLSAVLLYFSCCISLFLASSEQHPRPLTSRWATCRWR